VNTIITNPFVEQTLEKLSILGNVTAKSKFGGFGIYLNEVMFGLIAEDVLYLKADNQTITRFQAAGGRPFVYDGTEDSDSVKTFWTFPSEVLESPDDLKEWGELAYEAAVRSKKEVAPKPKTVEKAIVTPPKAEKTVPKKKAAKKKAKPAKKKATVAKKKAKAKKAKPTPKKSKKSVKKTVKKPVSKKKPIKKKAVKKGKAKKAAKKKRK
jgi:DNA transformation protein